MPRPILNLFFSVGILPVERVRYFCESAGRVLGSLLECVLLEKSTQAGILPHIWAFIINTKIKIEIIDYWFLEFGIFRVF